MKPTTLMISSLLAGALAGIAPQVPDWIRAASPLTTTGGAGGGTPQPIQTAWPGSPKQPLSLSLEKVPPQGTEAKNNLLVANLPLRNPSKEPVVACIEAHGQGARGENLKLTINPASVKIQPYGAVIQEVEISGVDVSSDSVPGTGFLRIFRGDSADSANICAPKETSAPTEVEIRIPERPIAGAIFLLPLIAAGIVVVVTAVNLRRKHIGLRHAMGVANWAFDKSWGANVTLGGSLLIALLGLSAFPGRPQLMTKPSYAMLQLLFGALVSLAPLVYNLIRQETVVNNGGFPQVSVHGYVIMFLMAGGLVLWAAMGQVVTLGVLAEEFLRCGVVDRTTARLLQTLAGTLLMLLWIYGFRSLYATAKSVSAPAGTVLVRPSPQMPAAGGAYPAPMTEWSIL
jgi:hypothetical protein